MGPQAVPSRVARCSKTYGWGVLLVWCLVYFLSFAGEHPESARFSQVANATHGPVRRHAGPHDRRTVRAMHRQAANHSNAQTSYNGSRPQKTKSLNAVPPGCKQLHFCVTGIKSLPRVMHLDPHSPVTSVNQWCCPASCPQCGEHASSHSFKCGTSGNSTTSGSIIGRGPPAITDLPAMCCPFIRGKRWSIKKDSVLLAHSKPCREKNDVGCVFSPRLTCGVGAQMTERAVTRPIIRGRRLSFSGSKKPMSKPKKQGCISGLCALRSGRMLRPNLSPISSPKRTDWSHLSCCGEAHCPSRVQQCCEVLYESPLSP